MTEQSNWDILRKQKARDTTKNRDVYGEQQLNRGKLHRMQTMKSRLVLITLVSILAGLAMYILLSILLFLAGSIGIGSGSASSNGQQQTVTQSGRDDTGGMVTIKHGKNGYYVESVEGDRLTKNYSSVKAIPKRSDWMYTNGDEYGVKDGETDVRAGSTKRTQSRSNTARGQTNGHRSLAQTILIPDKDRLLAAIITGIVVYSLLYVWAKRNLKAQNLTSDMRDINHHKNDRHVMLPEEIMHKFELFPDAGAHSHVDPTSLISHTAIENKGLKSVNVTERYNKDVRDESGNIVAYKGEAIRDQNGNVVTKKKPIIDEKFMDALFTASDDPQDPLIRKHYDLRNVAFKPINIDDVGYWKKLGVKTAADVINKDWHIPEYETQRPAGAYWVDTAPANTMVLAITRAGKDVRI